jgi:hypothetical protein
MEYINDKLFNLFDLFDRYFDTGETGSHFDTSNVFLRRWNRAFGESRSENEAVDYDYFAATRYSEELKAHIFKVLDFYCLLEVAMIMEVVPDVLPEEISKNVLYFLRHPVVSREMIDYRSSLPLSLLTRLSAHSNTPGLNIYPQEQMMPLFYSYIELTWVMTEDNDVKIFLEDIGKQERGNAFWDTLYSLKELKNNIERVHAEEDWRRTEISGFSKHALAGYFKWLQFLYQFDDLLESCEFFPEIEEAILKHYSYLFIEDRYRAIIDKTKDLASYHVEDIQMNKSPELKPAEYEIEKFVEMTSRIQNKIDKMIGALA